MDVFTIKDQEFLINRRNGLNVSIYLPTPPKRVRIRQDTLRLKNLIKQAENELLLRGGLNTHEIDDLLQPAKSLLIDRVYWQRQSEGLALFISPDWHRIYRLPIGFEKLVVVGERFHIKPLLPMMSGDGCFFLLALSQNSIGFFHGSRQSMDEIFFEDIPTSQAEALRFDDHERQLQFHTSTESPGTEYRGAVFHGHGVGSDTSKKDRILRYFQKVDRVVANFLSAERSPLILAGVDYLVPIYHEANSYPALIEEGILGNPENKRVDKLHMEAWSLVEPYFLNKQKEAYSRYRELSKKELTSSNIEAILPATHFGRVEILFVSLGVQIWGRFESDTNQVVIHETIQPDDQDILDLAAIKTIVNRCFVYAEERENMPCDGMIAAIFRY